MALGLDESRVEKDLGAYIAERSSTTKTTSPAPKSIPATRTKHPHPGVPDGENIS